MMEQKPFDSRRIALYVVLQSATLVFCWAWFGILWSVAFFNFSYDQVEWWLLFGSGLAGLYGLRPNLERAIDSYWLGAKTNPTQLKERAAQLLPVKRRIDVIFSLLLIAIFVIVLIFVGLGWMQDTSTPGGQQ